MHKLLQALGRALAYETVWSKILVAVSVGALIACFVALVAPEQALFWGAIALTWVLVWQARQELKSELRLHHGRITRLEDMFLSLRRHHKDLERSVRRLSRTYAPQEVSSSTGPLPLSGDQQDLLEGLLTQPIELQNKARDFS